MLHWYKAVPIKSSNLVLRTLTWTRMTHNHKNSNKANVDLQNMPGAANSWLSPFALRLRTLFLTTLACEELWSFSLLDLETTLKCGDLAQILLWLELKWRQVVHAELGPGKHSWDLNFSYCLTFHVGIFTY